MTPKCDTFHCFLTSQNEAWRILHLGQNARGTATPWKFYFTIFRFPIISGGKCKEKQSAGQILLSINVFAFFFSSQGSGELFGARIGLRLDTSQPTAGICPYSGENDYFGFWGYSSFLVLYISRNNPKYNHWKMVILVDVFGVICRGHFVE